MCLKIAVLVSGNGSNLQALIDFGLSGHIVGVICNKPNAYALERARNANIATRVIQHQDFPSREQFDAEMHQQLLNWQVDIVILAGFMRILSAGFVSAWHGKMLNIHPSLLPAYKGVNTHQRILNSGEVWHGCSVHFVTPELDAGPCVAQGVLQVKASEDVAQLAARVHQLEHQIYPQVLEWLCTGVLRVEVNGNHVNGDDAALDQTTSINVLYRERPLLQPIRFCL